MKALRIEDSGFVWEVPASAIAENRAKYYAERDKDTTYESEFEFTMGDNYEIKDWFFNNMDWQDVADKATLVKSPEAMKEPRLNHSGCKSKIVERAD